MTAAFVSQADWSAPRKTMPWRVTSLHIACRSVSTVRQHVPRSSTTESPPGLRDRRAPRLSGCAFLRLEPAQPPDVLHRRLFKNLAGKRRHRLGESRGHVRIPHRTCNECFRKPSAKDYNCCHATDSKSEHQQVSVQGKAAVVDLVFRWTKWC